MENKYIGLKTAIEETEKYFKEQIGSMETFKAHQGRMLTSVSLIIATFGFIKSQTQKSISISPLLVIIIGLLFIIYVTVYSFLIMPISMEMPIKIEKSVLREAFSIKAEKKILENKLENYINAIDVNRKKINKLIFWSRLSTIVYLIILVVAIIIFLPNNLVGK